MRFFAIESIFSGPWIGLSLAPVISSSVWFAVSDRFFSHRGQRQLTTCGDRKKTGAKDAANEKGSHRQEQMRLKQDRRQEFDELV
jgi:hypothetical protein